MTVHYAHAAGTPVEQRDARGAHRIVIPAADKSEGLAKMAPQVFTLTIGGEATCDYGQFVSLLCSSPSLVSAWSERPTSGSASGASRLRPSPGCGQPVWRSSPSGPMQSWRPFASTAPPPPPTDSVASSSWRFARFAASPRRCSFRPLRSLILTSSASMRAAGTPLAL